MTTFIVIIQEGQQAASVQKELGVGLKDIAVKLLGDDPGRSDVKWKIIPGGFGWTAGRPSNSSVILCVVPENLRFTTRKSLMKRVNDLWVGQTGADRNELLIFTRSSTL